ncbi:ogr/Delta-like zinc finger family protein [Buttiauxella noackiae]|uniref:ogr/Delta-like zinc finger family protein n=1 Tax=Buttiauxella noackiae TaxID=82992 RepID=UPI0007E4387F
MMRCPLCSTAGHTRETAYLEDGSKEMIVQCQNVYCSATFVTNESLFMAVNSIQKPRITGQLCSSPDESDTAINAKRESENG